MARDRILELRYSPLSALLVKMAAHPRLIRNALRLALRLEGGEFFSGSARQILKEQMGVSIGAFSYGGCFTLGRFQRNTVVGRYASIGPGVRTYVRNHPTQTLSTHPFFYNRAFGLIPEDTIPFGHLTIGHDAWIGCNAVVAPQCKRIGIGAVVAAGTLVVRNVPDFAVVGGNPGELLCYRFSPIVKTLILESRWWDINPTQLTAFIPQVCQRLPADLGACTDFLQALGAVGQRHTFEYHVTRQDGN